MFFSDAIPTDSDAMVFIIIDFPLVATTTRSRLRPIEIKEMVNLNLSDEVLASCGARVGGDVRYRGGGGVVLHACGGIDGGARGTALVFVTALDAR